MQSFTLGPIEILGKSDWRKHTMMMKLPAQCAFGHAGLSDYNIYIYKVVVSVTQKMFVRS
jgi:hypothetical protein